MDTYSSHSRQPQDMTDFNTLKHHSDTASQHHSGTALKHTPAPKNLRKNFYKNKKLLQNLLTNIIHSCTIIIVQG